MKKLQLVRENRLLHKKIISSKKNLKKHLTFVAYALQ